MLSRPLLVALLLAVATPAVAFDTRTLGQGGSITLDELLPRLAKSRKLTAEIEDAVAASGKKAEDTNCIGNRFPGQWQALGGGRVSPYTCEINGKWLRINARVTVLGRGGRVFPRVSRAAQRYARAVRETNLKWTWLATEPKED